MASIVSPFRMCVMFVTVRNGWYLRLLNGWSAHWLIMILQRKIHIMYFVIPKMEWVCAIYWESQKRESQNFVEKYVNWAGFEKNIRLERRFKKVSEEIGKRRRPDVRKYIWSREWEMKSERGWRIGNIPISGSDQVFKNQVLSSVGRLLYRTSKARCFYNPHCGSMFLTIKTVATSSMFVCALRFSSHALDLSPKSTNSLVNSLFDLRVSLVGGKN